MAQINNYNHYMSATPQYQMQSETHYSKLAEWYLTGCLLLLILQGVFLTFWVGDERGEKCADYVLERITGVALAPSELYFLTVGGLIGVVIMLGGLGQSQSRTLGLWSFIGIWVIHGAATVHGILRGNFSWIPDVRWMIVPSVVVPWVVMLAHKVRYDVVLWRFVKIAAPLAALNAARGMFFMTKGAKIAGHVERRWSAGITFEGDLVLLLAYIMVLARILTGKTKAIWLVLILAAGCVLSLSKISISCFIMATIFSVFLVIRMGRTHMGGGVSKTALRLLLVGFSLAIVVWFGANFRGGVGVRYLRERAFKVNVAKHKRNIATGRVGIWTQAFDQFRSSPIVGLGIGTRLQGKKRIGPRSLLPYHNYYLRYLAQTGLIGFSVVAGAFLLWWSRSFRALKQEPSPERLWVRIGFIAYVMAIAFSGIYTEVLSSHAVSYLFWIVIAMEAVAHSEILTDPSNDMYLYNSYQRVSPGPHAV